MPCCSRAAPALIALLLAALLLLTGGCRPAPEREAARTVTDDLGRHVHVAEQPQRVVTLAPNLTEIVYAAGAGTRLVGVTTADDYPPAVDTLARFGMLPTNFEAIAALAPDLALATDQVNPPHEADTFEALGIPLYFFSFEGLDDIWQSIRTAGALLGTEAAAEAAADSLERAMRRLSARTAQAEERPHVLLLAGDETLYAFGAGSYVHALIDAAGGESITAAIDTPAPVLTDEYVLVQQPDVIVGAFGAGYDPQRLLELHPTWDVVPAVRNGRVYSIDADLVNRPGPRVVEGARQIARLLHPSLFDGAEPADAEPAT